MLLEDIENKKILDKVTVRCDECPAEFLRFKRDVKKSRQRFSNKDLCRSCSARASAAAKPQCSKEFWDSDDRRKLHSKTMKESSAYYEAIANRDTSGEKNSRFGVPVSPETKLKMSKARTGKIGKQATAWKTGSTRLISRIRRALDVRHDWGGRVKRRVDYVCEDCGVRDLSNHSHHKEPLKAIIDRLLIDKELTSDDERFLYLIEHPDIVDQTLNNGACYCLSCHKKAHSNWGSKVKP
ncbi:hypothetical protein SmphiM12_003 [Sinorhizobium phage phiM12]|uniref:Nuclease associated modular domain-containing protein n=1 Tax=Sinorhizobium phage phiM12 TaxID=1357423 RepID=S5MP99_9CAUD|nr:hypothetical protein AB690_gp002 [Sinorhizobium phage phiM12]AGR47635.1 hypothetical protein SmphiM12_003 [Sinorhizobium phage phiM12]